MVLNQWALGPLDHYDDISVLDKCPFQTKFSVTTGQENWMTVLFECKQCSEMIMFRELIEAKYVINSEYYEDTVKPKDARPLCY